MIKGTRSKSTKKIGHGARALRAAFGASVAAAALVGTFASISSAHALTVPIGITLPGLPVIDAGSITLPVLGSDAGVILSLPLVPNDAGTIKLPLIGEDGGIVSLPGLGTDGGVALLCTSDATCTTGFECDAILKICLPSIVEQHDASTPADSGTFDSGPGQPVSEDAGSPPGTSDAGGSDDDGSASGDSPDASTTSTGSDSATGTDGAGDSTSGNGASSTATSDAGADGGSDGSGDTNGVSCSMSPAGTRTSRSIPFELVLGFFATVTFGAIRRRRRAAR